ncbi:MAG: 4-(cytidine 5'-diphospho)-2-C-methyl-D-erythritol kinase, partial [Alphaproteobacteria bacterium]|nr:4-(cytidine 5'-diphospho)-2-C-methyl-D-erythritol kinase [Alphaproteobacteria bacterium]
MLIEWAPAKVNLYLHAVGRRPDGYHLLDSVAVFAGIGDELRGDDAGELSLRIAGDHAAALQSDADNLVLRAAHALAAAAGRPARARLVLEKRLPVAAGIGGGSADAAATLRLLVRLWEAPQPAGALAAIGAGLGADVPVCLASRPARLSGIGERLEPAPALPPFGLVLANPGVPLATAAVFRARTGPFSAPPALPAGWA